MKGICLCCECAYYSMKQHKCNRGCKVEPELSKGEDVRFSMWRKNGRKLRFYYKVQ